MNNTAEVFLWGTRIGIIHQENDRPYASFEYDRDFLNSGIEVSPIRMPLGEMIYEFPDLSGTSFHGLPGLVSDSLPDKFGNLVIEKWLTMQGKSLNDFTAIDRLCYTGKRGMGALEYKPANMDIKDINAYINVSEMVKFASEVLSNREKVTLSAEEELSYSRLVQVGSSAGGARAKALIAWNEKTNEIKSGQLDLEKDFDYWLMKFDNVAKNGDHGIEDGPQYTLIEYAYYKMALDCGIKMNECKIFKSGNENHFMTKRFDRKDGKKIHMLSLGGMAHIDYNTPGICGYELAAEYMKRIGLKYDDTEQLFRRMVFNCLAVNQDDHVKNISFLMDKSGKWELAPAYDITFSYDPENMWLRAHQMTVNNKTMNITIEDIITAGINMGISKKKSKDIVEEIRIIVSNFLEYAQDEGIREETASVIMNTIEKA